MTQQKSFSNRFIQNKDGVIGPVPRRDVTIRVKTVGDYPSTPKAYLAVAELYGSNELRGGGICDELMALVQHMLTEEEASLVRHLKPGARDITAQMIADAAHRPVDEVKKILDHLALKKRIITSREKEDNTYYHIVPIVPGVFELVLQRTSEQEHTEWHRTFAKLFDELFNAGFTVARERAADTLRIRYLPVMETIEVHPMALPSDKLEELWSPYKTFAVTNCQCRLAEDAIDRWCGRPMENCTSMGIRAEQAVKSGRSRKVELKELIEIKKEAEASGLVTWTMNVDPEKASNTSCSCCGCCCRFMRRAIEFSVPAAILPPHFLPVHYSNKCNSCGKCALACPMGATTVDVKHKIYQHDKSRCIGCGQCVIACDQTHALTMDAVPDFELPPPTANGRTPGYDGP